MWAVCYVVKLLFKMTKKWLDVFRDRHPNATHAKIIKDYLDNGTVRVIHIGLTNGEAMEEDGCILDTDEGLDEKLDSKFAGKSEMRVTC
ncbi:MAG: hypothetical protein LBR38_06660 [Synergistaceae bacterium]|nr:hypothetical protein [Synergistaceae bacterium]